MPVDMRRAGPDDLDALVAAMTEFYAESSFAFEAGAARAAFKRLLDDPRLGSAWLIVADGEVAGYFVMTLGYSMEMGGIVTTLDDLFVRAMHRGRGLGRAAVSRFRSEAEALGACALHLEVDRANTAAFELYRSVGFRERTLQSMVLPLAPALHEATAPQRPRE